MACNPSCSCCCLLMDLGEPGFGNCGSCTSATDGWRTMSAVNMTAKILVGKMRTFIIFLLSCELKGTGDSLRYGNPLIKMQMLRSRDALFAFGLCCIARAATRPPTLPAVGPLFYVNSNLSSPSFSTLHAILSPALSHTCLSFGLP